MRGDFGRQTFRADKRYRAVLMQQGRVQLDADWNEQQAIDQYRLEAEGTDLIGHDGAPKTAPGFALGVTGAGDDITIGAGHFYVDGVLCENDEQTLFSQQPDLRSTDGSLLPSTDGLYLGYLEAWERHVTSLEDELVKETALGGPDTATRTKTVWQVRLLRVTDPGGTLSAATQFPEWAQLLQENHVDPSAAGKLSARSQPEEPSPDPLCILPASAGYRRLENHLYRVEIHTAGDVAHARFKWSRDNGSVASRIDPDENGVVVNGSVISVAEIGKDDLLTFASDPLPEWLELTDDRYELLEQRGQLARVQTVDPITREITFTPDALLTLDAAQHPVVRRWDQSGDDATADGVAITGDWQPLEDGVEVRFEPGTYRVGDFWLVPARTALGLETGTVEWPHDGANPIPQPPAGTPHRFARLGLVRRNGGVLSLVPGTDLRPLFPPLTAITAEDVSFDDSTCQIGTAKTVQDALDALCQRSGSLCTLLVGPGDDLATALNRIAGVQDALICIRAGTYALNAPLHIEDRGNIEVTGAGLGTRIVAATSEAALVFSKCASVKVSDIHVETGVAAPGGDANGALTFIDCGSVAVEGASVRCVGGAPRGVTCVTVRNAAPAAGSTARILDNDLEVGHLQTGLLLANVDRSWVADNLIHAGSRPADAVLLQDVTYRGALRRQIFSNPTPGPAAPPAMTNATVTFNSQVLHFRTDLGLIHASRNDTEWQRAINALNPAGIANPRLLERYLKRLASNLIHASGGGTGGSAAFASVITGVLAQDSPTAEQGIVVGGTAASDVRLRDNTVLGAVQGIHVGLSAGKAGGRAGVVSITGNTVQVGLPASATRERHGIFVGSADSIVIEGNYIGLSRVGRNANLRVEGIKLFGILGRRVIVRHNHMGRQFAVGVTFAPLNLPLPVQPLWIVTENEMEAAAMKIDVPARAPRRPGVPNANAVLQNIRGRGDNFA